jgi:hypothetical protein
MFLFNKILNSRGLLLIALMSVWGVTACNPITTESTTTTTSTVRFASGTKTVKIITSTEASGSYALPTTTPTATPIPSPYPGYDGTTTYLPGVSPTTYFDTDGTTGITKPSWLLDFQMGITGTASGSCARFGTGANVLEPDKFYRVSERDCGSTSCNGGTCNGTGVGTDPVFFRIILDRDTAQIGSAENLLVQVEYQASGLHMNTDGTDPDLENNLDQLWKIQWNSSLVSTVTPKSFSVFVPPNYAACKSSGTGNDSATSNCTVSTYRGSPVKVRQFLIPLSAYPNMKVIQFTRMKSRITANNPDDYVANFCSTNQALCLGVVIRSVTITRM